MMKSSTYLDHQYVPDKENLLKNLIDKSFIKKVLFSDHFYPSKTQHFKSLIVPLTVYLKSLLA